MICDVRLYLPFGWSSVLFIEDSLNVVLLERIWCFT